MDNTYNDKECAIAALAEVEGRNIDEKLFIYAQGTKRNVAHWAVKALEYRAAKQGFSTLGEYKNYLESLS